MSGRFITFEGIDGCGKTTQLKLLEQALTNAGIPCLCTREPGGSTLGREIRKSLLDPDYCDPPAARAELLLFLADRAQHVEKIIHPALKRGVCVISDRFTDSTLAYQGYARGLDLNELRTLNRMATDGLIPDCTIVFDLSPETSAARVLAATEEFRKADRLEAEDKTFRRKIREGFLDIAAQEPDRVTVISADGSPGSIHSRVIYTLVSLPGLETIHV